MIRREQPPAVGPGGMDEHSPSVGIDLVPIANVEDSLARLGARYLERIYTPHEIESCRGRHGVRAEQLAARFAAKEATIKVLCPRDRQPPWQDIEVRRAPGGDCEVVLYGAATSLASERGIERLALSVSHCAGLAIAVVVGSGGDPRPEGRSDPS